MTMNAIKKEMLIAGNFNRQSFDLIPAKQSFSKEENDAHKAFFKPLTDKVLDLYPNIEFDYSRFPSIVLSNAGKTLAVLTHTDINQKTEHLKSFGCTAALFTDAFSNFKTLNMVKEILPVFGANFSDMNIREDLGDNQKVCLEALTALKRGTGDFVHCANLTHTYLTPGVLADNYMKVNGLEPGWINGERDRNFSQEYKDLMATNPAAFRFSNVQDEALSKEIDAAYKAAKNNLINGVVPLTPEEVSPKTKLADGIHKSLKQQNDQSLIEMEWLEKRMTELDLHFNLRKDRTYKDLPLPFVHDMTIHNKYNRELISWRTGSGNVSINDSAIHDDNAGKLAADIAYKKFGHSHVHFNIGRSAKKRYSEEELGMICEKKMNQLIEAGFEPEQIILPKEWQYLVDLKINEMKNVVTLDQATPAQVAESKQVMDNLSKKDLPESTKKAATDSVEIPNSPTGQQSVKAAPMAPAMPAASVPGVKGSAVAPVVPIDAAKASAVPVPFEKKRIVVNGCYLVENKEKDSWLLYGVNGSVKADNIETMKKIVNKLVEHEGIDIKKVKGCWFTPENEPLYTLAEIKKHEASVLTCLDKSEQAKALIDMKEKFSFKLAYDAVQEIKADKLDNIALPVEPAAKKEPESRFQNVDLSADEPKPTVFKVRIDDELPIRKITDVEREQAEALGIDLDNSDAYKELQKAREGSGDASSKDLENSKEADGVDYSAALNMIGSLEKKAELSNNDDAAVQKAKTRNKIKPQ